MIVRQLKLKLNNDQETQLSDWFRYCTGIYNFGLRKIDLNAKNKIYFSKFDFQNLLANHSKKLGMPSHTTQAILNQAWSSWYRCFKKVARGPKLKSIRNKLRSIPFPDSIKAPKNNRVNVPGMGKLKFHKQELPSGKIKCGRIIKKTSGWYLQVTIDVNHMFNIKKTNTEIGIDTGFNHLAVLSNGTKIENNRFYIKSQERLALAQRGKKKKLAARLQERIANQRKDYNHKVSKDLIENYGAICITNDTLKRQASLFGKSVQDAGISQLRNFLIYKGGNHGRKVILVDSKNTTKTCSVCGSFTGPTGLGGLKVRTWGCSACGAVHDRDINAACVILKAGLGCSLGVQES